MVRPYDRAYLYRYRPNKNPNPLEKEVQRSCIDWLLRNPRIFAWRNNSTGLFDREKGFFRTSPKRGAPDILAIGPGGKFIGIEVKRQLHYRHSDPLKELRVEQRNFRESVLRAGGEYWVVHSVAELEELWENYNDKTETPAQGPDRVPEVF